MTDFLDTNDIVPTDWVPENSIIKVIGVGQPGTEDNPQGELWADDEIEKIEVSTRKKKEKKDRERKPGFFKVTFTRIKEAGEKVGEKVKEVAYDLYQDIAEDEPNEN